ncbi:DegT/DnrJ/EryC1/StrS family aminotransferase [Paenibacillus sp. 598K]|uniref:DegT/DnrJ/EryC1/StrS family aminotransferase n=1 Tax=Paenibacillus sp. 598K TaxID=1117987 RepID=UPI000FFF1D35|nr:DegT/DnrJ/EryC1/StrS family aminotransferase [Paenibacillus sp. 598K]
MKYALASSTWDHRELEAMQTVIQSGRFTMGAKVEQFEQAFANYTGSRYAVMVNSGSSANLLMIAALFYSKAHSIRAGDEVIVPAVSWATTYYPLYQYGLKLKFVDIDPCTLNYDLNALSKAISDRTRLLMAVNLLGNPNDFSNIQELIESKNIILIEDNCESLGALWDGRQTGTFGLMGSYSSFFSHHISTIEGGLVVTDDEELYHLLLSLRAHGWTRNLPSDNRVCGAKSDDPFEESFRFVLPGYNVRPGELNGALGLEQLQKLPDMISTRRKNALRYQSLFADHPWFDVQRELGESSWFGFALILKPTAPFTRKQVTDLLQSRDIECRPIVAGNFAKNEVLQYFDYEIHGSLKHAQRIDRHGLFVGNHHYELDNELHYLKDTLEELNRV